jgi:chromosomal replication initiation ATPase DnaA
VSLITYKDVVREAGLLFKIHPRDIQSKYQFNFLIPARFAVWKALNETGTSYSQIGRWFERDHSTIRNGVLRAAEIMEKDYEYRAKVKTLINYKQGASNA